MINIHELKLDNFVIAEYEDQERRGFVSDITLEDKMIRVTTDENKQDFWYDPENVYPIKLSDAEMGKFNFEKELLSDGAVKYKKDAFRLVIAKPEDFSYVEMWYREDIRKNPNVHFVHQLQNQFHDMTKIFL
ncbi:MAG TPA: hypothetical protein VFQ86_11190 [Arachidicoccus soli]|uniref:Uncharacterized protein n=1 Tax=Arachidicoccus soli TaxID=2341117 RepID=A0A386HSG2_9BACT|nr:hypothetical protein [Arachidicoccus soli]AYD48599.1 hypothetical protein D6B99_13900 [Arachidicoccus soli]HEU0228297.1 hypothetical protein [Arachidicoccus soli]